MRYVALLRAINVGGNSKMEMARLKACFEQLGLESVRTFTNLGNVFFETNAKDRARLVKKIERAIEADFSLSVPVLLRTSAEIARITKAVPKDWVTNKRMSCNVMFLWPEQDSRSVLRRVPSRADVEDLRYIPGALVWRIDRKDAGKSHVRKLIGSDLYKKLTIRNINTVRKLDAMLR